MSKYLGMTDDEIFALKGADLKEVAAELAIPGRSTMKAADLRAAVHVEIITQRNLAAVTADPFPPQLSMPDECFEAETNDILADPETLNAIAVGEEEAEKFELVPNRKARRDAARKQRKAAGRIAQKMNRNN